MSDSTLIGRKLRAAKWHAEFRINTTKLNLQLRKYRSKLTELEQGIKRAGRPVLFFNPSSRIQHMSQNAAFSLLTSWGFRLRGIPVVYYSCNQGMLQCQLGAVGRPTPANPPCSMCTPLSDRMYADRMTSHLEMAPEHESGISIDPDESLDQMAQYEYQDLPLGEICIPSLQWSLRRFNLQDDAGTRMLFWKFLSSAVNLVDDFERLILRTNPEAVVLFNGISYPEAVVREIAIRRGITAVTHEVSVMPFSAFFSHEHATAYQLDIPEDFELTSVENRMLDEYLSRRFKGEFTMGGIRFWPEMNALPEEIETAIENYAQMVVVFTNVVFDTSQAHANILFDDMFSWLEKVIRLARDHSDTLFIIRAHPDELRPGKQSEETVSEEIRKLGGDGLPNVIFIPPNVYISSYELINRSKFVMVYNSSIGLEASLLGSQVLAGGQSRYSHYPTVYLPDSRDGYNSIAEDWLGAALPLEASREAAEASRKFMFYHLYRASLDFSDFLQLRSDIPGSVLFRDFDVLHLHPERCEEIDIIQKGVFEGEPFVYPSTHG